tara:strand:+ start:307 stop:621 length:315 start_codon:yes stop_codon:yes gene_type:complete
MLFFLFKNITLSIIIILLVHYIYNYFKDNLTVPKVKDLVNKPQIQYNEIIETIKESNIEDTMKETIDQQNMEEELKNYINDLSSTMESTTPIGDLPESEHYQMY